MSDHALHHRGIPGQAELVRRGGSSPEIVRSRQFRSSASRNTGKYETRVWRLTFGPEDLAGVIAAFESVAPVTWTPPPPDDGAAIEVRFLGDAIDVRYGPGVYFEASVELEEVC